MFCIFSFIRSDNVFWMTTGLYPQEFIITFKEPIEFRQLHFVTHNGMFHMKFIFLLRFVIQLIFTFLVKRFVMFTTSNQEPKNFETILEKSIMSMIV